MRGIGFFSPRAIGSAILKASKLKLLGKLPWRQRSSNTPSAKDGAAIKVYVELNDVNYPGCKYNLTYIPAQRQLVGTYFQAAMQQTYEVTFERE